MKNVTKRVVMNIALTADQWQLFTASMKCGTAARALNSTFNALSKRGANKDEFRVGMEAVMEQYSDYGASDSEPRWMLEDLLEMHFN